MSGANEEVAHRHQAMVSALREQLVCGLTARMRVTSNSMVPLIRAGDEVELVGVADPARLRPGDVVTFEQGGALMTHRLMGRTGQGDAHTWLTQGDNLPVPDPPWPGTQLVGRVMAVLPQRGRAMCLDRGLGRWLNACLRAALSAERRVLHTAHRLIGRQWASPGLQRVVFAMVRLPFRLARYVVVWVFVER